MIGVNDILDKFLMRSRSDDANLYPRMLFLDAASCPLPGPQLPISFTKFQSKKLNFAKATDWNYNKKKMMKCLFNSINIT